jgi:hypothetical protein
MTSRSMHAALAGALTLAATFGVGVAVPEAAFADGPCAYRTNDTAQIHENPSLNSVVRKTVEAGHFVQGPLPCVPLEGSDGRPWYAVDCACADDDIGFIIWYKLDPL